MRGSQILNLALRRLQLECMLECVRQILLELISEPAVYQLLVLHDSELAKFELYTHPRSVILSDLGGDNHDCHGRPTKFTIHFVWRVSQYSWK